MAQEKKDAKYYEELVEVELFKDDGKYKNDVFVAVNGKGMIVPRGKKVKIPRKYAICLQNSITQDKKTALKIDELKNAGAQAAAQL